jgi:hypothetical protein
LIYVAFISRYDDLSTKEFFSRFKDIFNDETVDLGRVIIKIFRLLLAGVAIESESFTAEMSALIEACTKMDWLAMRDAKVTLFDFLVEDSACKGQPQDLWKNRAT